MTIYLLFSVTFCIVIPTENTISTQLCKFQLCTYYIGCRQTRHSTIQITFVTLTIKTYFTDFFLSEVNWLPPSRLEATSSKTIYPQALNLTQALKISPDIVLRLCKCVRLFSTASLYFSSITSLLKAMSTKTRNIKMFVFIFKTMWDLIQQSASASGLYVPHFYRQLYSSCHYYQMYQFFSLSTAAQILQWFQKYRA